MALSRTQLASYVRQRAPLYGVDPDAALAVASQEGIGGGIGDAGTSFGPWQLHKGGAYPASAPQDPQQANAWAWSKTGVDYALSRMGMVAGGQRGDQAIESIVSRFERPANVLGEVMGAEAAYHGQAGTPPVVVASRPRPGGSGGLLGGIESAAEGAFHAVEGAAEGGFEALWGAIKTPFEFFKLLVWLVNPLTWLRAVEALFGFVLILAGILVVLGADKAVAELPIPTGKAAQLAAAE